MCRRFAAPYSAVSSSRSRLSAPTTGRPISGKWRERECLLRERPPAARLAVTAVGLSPTSRGQRLLGNSLSGHTIPLLSGTSSHVHSMSDGEQAPFPNAGLSLETRGSFTELGKLLP